MDQNGMSKTKTMADTPDLGFAKRTVKPRPTSGLGPRSNKGSGPPQQPGSPEGGGGGGTKEGGDALPNASESQPCWLDEP